MPPRVFHGDHLFRHADPCRRPRSIAALLTKVTDEGRAFHNTCGDSAPAAASGSSVGIAHGRGRDRAADQHHVSHAEERWIHSTRS